MFSTISRKFSEKELWGIAFMIAMILSGIMVAVNIGIYRSYRISIFESEQDELLTIARTIGRGLEQYVEQELDKTDLCFDSLETILTEESAATTEEIRKAAEAVLNENSSLYRSCVCLQDGQELFSLGDRSESAGLPDTEGMKPGNAVILGKYQAETGWYEMLVGKTVPFQGGNCTLIFAMDLDKVYRENVSPVRIGDGGYSVVKDSTLAIIMHHAKNQIGMDALYDRQETYPDLDLSSLSEWLNLQRIQEEGTGILDSYVWDDPDLKPVQRIVAFTTIDIRGERWIVNSTLPTSELAVPLRRMYTTITAFTLLYLAGIGLILVVSTSAIRRLEHQRKEISYLKEINRGMEAIALKNDEIRHYQRVQSMGMMSSHIAHEFNNYLTPVMVYGELLEDDESISQDNRSMLREMLKSVEQAAKLSRELLDFSRMDAGTKAAPIDLTAETKDAVSVVRQLAPAKISFAADITEQPAWIRGREGMMQHILMNLCKNAFHAMEETERKELRILYTVHEAKNTGDAGAAGPETGRTAVLTVSDTGCGIKADNRREIFEPFYTTKGSRQGTGLGLSVVRSMVENAGGMIEVESEEGKGTAFIMRFPAFETREKLFGCSEQKKGKAQKILCVCRSEKALEPWKEWLDSFGSGIEYTSHEAAVVARLQKDIGFCDMLITENELETMSGIDLAQIVKRVNPAVRVCLLTQEKSERQQWYLGNGILDEIRTSDA